jgi:hypothetical protein
VPDLRSFMGHRYPVAPRSPLAQSRLTRAARHLERHAALVGSGYRAGAFEVEAAYPPGSPPTVNGTTPCYPGELQRDDIPVPEVLWAN